MSERRSTREIVVWIAGLVVAAGLLVLGATYLVSSDLTANVLAAANPPNVLAAAKPPEDAAPPLAKPADDAALPVAKPAEDAVPPGAERAEEAASPAAKPADDTALPATMQLGADPKFASIADMPEQQQQFLSIISDFAQKYETAPNDMAKNAFRQQRDLRQQRARAICGIMNDLTVTNWVGTVNTLPGTDRGKGVLAVSLDKRSTIGTWGRKYNTLIKPRTAADIQLSPGQTVVFSGKFFRAKGDCIAEHSPTFREAMTQPNWIVRLSAIKPAQSAASPAAKPADDAALPVAKPAEDAVPPGAERAEEAASPAAKPADDTALPATMQLGADPKFASIADMPAQQQQFLSIISDFAQKYETAPNDMAKNAFRQQRDLRQQRARAICGIMNDLTVTNWVGTVNTLPGTDRGKGVLAVSLDKRSTIGTWGRKYNTLIKPRTAADIQLSPGQTVVFSGKFFRAKGDCIAEHSPTFREAMTQPNWIVRLSAIKPAQSAASPAAKPADDAALPVAKPAEDAVPPGAERAEEAASPAAKPTEDGALPAAKPAENAVPPGAERAEEVASPVAKPTDDAALSAAKPAETAVPPGAERAEEPASPAAKPAEDAALPAATPAENAVPPGAERAEEAASPAAKPAEDGALPAAKPAENAAPAGAERAEEAATPAAKPLEDGALPAAKPAENVVPLGAERADEATLSGATMQLGADLYEEDPKPMGKLYPGSVDWHAEPVTGKTDDPSDLAAQADIGIPELKLKVILSIRHNSDAIRPASPRLEIHFTVPSDFAHQGINSISGILMSGFVPLALSAVKVSDNSFEFDLGRLGLSRSLHLLKESTWFYVPLVYNDGGRALLSVEKDPRGERAFRDAHIFPAER